MNADPQRIEELFHAARECAPGERAAFLSRACDGDRELRAEVEALLGEREEDPEFLERPAWELLGERESEVATECVPEPGLPFERLGEYRLVRRLGEGGMGIVYLAVQESLGREVALKVIRPERVGSPEAAERFSREVDAVSELSHPNIVAVFGSGTAAGVRYFAMELVEGQGLDELLRDAALAGERVPTKHILGWIRDIARALAHAHGGGIIHRDIKPSNIRIAPEGHAMLMDFGVARHLELSTLTLTGSFRGTPRYASPEQVQARGIIDIRTDVYSLGATLYEAVTGRVPFEGETTEQVFHQILEAEPVPPRRLNPAISRDLETVVLTAIDKQAARRYQSMAAFADDLDRLLGGEVIRARPAGLATRTWRRVRRRPGLSAAIGVAALSLLALLVHTLATNRELERNNRDLAREADKSRRINAFLARMIASPAPGREGRDVKVVEALEKAVAEIDATFAGQPEAAAEVRHTIADTYRRLGLFAEAEVQARAASKLRRAVLGRDDPLTLSSLNILAIAILEQGRLSEATEMLRGILETRRRVQGPLARQTLGAMQNLSLVLRNQGEYGEALELLEEVVAGKRRVMGAHHLSTLRSISSLAILLRCLGRLEEAEQQLREVVVAQRERYGVEHRSTLISMNALGLTLGYQNRNEEAERIHREVYEIQLRRFGAQHSDTLHSMNSLALALKDLGRLGEAQELAERMLEIAEDVFDPRHRLCAAAHSSLGKVLAKREEFEAAEAELRNALEILSATLGAEHPDALLTAHGLGRVLEQCGKGEEALGLYLQAFSGNLSELGMQHVATRESLGSLCKLLERLGRREEAAAYRDRLK